MAALTSVLVNIFNTRAFFLMQMSALNGSPSVLPLKIHHKILSMFLHGEMRITFKHLAVTSRLGTVVRFLAIINKSIF